MIQLSIEFQENWTIRGRV